MLDMNFYLIVYRPDVDFVIFKQIFILWSKIYTVLQENGNKYEVFQT